MITLFRLHIVVLLWLSCYEKALAFRALPVWGGLDRTSALHRTAPVARTNRIDRRESSTQLYGIPKLFRWLVDLYPLVLESVGEGLSNNAMSVDHFYLDMNGIIHTCTHSNNDKLIPLKEQEMFLRIFAYTDRLYKLVNPKKSMFLAVDGVAPRAKMNQQRSRRFRSSKEREALIADHLAKEGKMPEDESFDSNCITPGTPFMYRLSIAFRKWIEHKMKTDKFWQNGAEVIFSGPDVPGEGEHKVMDLIRAEQKKAAVHGQDRHCLYGLDADLVMLSLVTHEPHFVLLREKIATRRDQGNVKKSVLEYTQEDFECLEITILRRMLKQHFRKLNAELDKKSASIAAADGAAGSSVGAGGIAKVHSEPARATLRSAVPAGKGAPPAPQFPLAEAQNPQWTVGFDLERIIDDFVFM
jgi:5'-3' exonuclease